MELLIFHHYLYKYLYNFYKNYTKRLKLIEIHKYIKKIKNNIKYTRMDNEIIPKLKFIGKIQKGDKINVKHMYVQPEGIYTTISRTLFKVDDRSNTLIFVNNTIKKSFELLLSHINSEKEFDKILCRNIANDLRNSKNGLTNLRETYNSDIMFCCKMDTFIEEVEAKIRELENKYDFLKLIDKNNNIENTIE
jgi:hypothetical protein